MNKLELQAKHLLSKIGNGETDGEKESYVESEMKSFAVDVLNMVEGLRTNQATMPVIKSMVEQYGITYNGKSRKFV